MSNYMDYIRWRGDISFRLDPPNAVDALIFCSLSYLRLEGRVKEHPEMPLTLREVAEEFFTLPDYQTRGRSQNDVDLLQLAAASRRFGCVKLVRYQEQFVPEEDTQFAAETFLLDDGSLFVAFRGTDNTLVGWKEDFNMCFQPVVPSQRLAQEYVQVRYAEYRAPMRICGHSKGGNLAVFSAARSTPEVQAAIVDIYNNDGPGFTGFLMGDPGYLAMVPKIHTYVPQGSVIGLLMEREEPYTIIKSYQFAVFQHDTFTWEVIGKEMTTMEELTADSRFLNATINGWLMDMDMEERNQMVEALFSLLMQGNVERTGQMFQLKNLRNYVRLLGSDENLRKVLHGEIENLLDAAKKSRKAPQETAEVPAEVKN